MIARSLAWSSRHPWIVIATAFVVALAGELGRRSLSSDVIPDLSDPQIVLVADWMGHSATEVATDVTKTLTTALQSVPGATAVRGSSMAGMAYVDVVFASGSKLESGRQAILDRVERVRPMLPDNARVRVGPLASSTGWVLEYALIASPRRESFLRLRQLQDDVLRPALQSITGVAEVASVGGVAEQVVVEAMPEELRVRGIAFSEVVSTLHSALAAHDRKSLQDLEVQPLDVVPIAGGPAQIRDVARVRVKDDMPTGFADLGGASRALGGIVIAQRGADVALVVDAVKRAIERERSRLPADVKLVIVYDRTDLVHRVGSTLLRALTEEVAVVVAVVLMFLLHWRSALVPLATLPLVLLMTFGAMWILGVPATIMSVGGIGIALGMAVDADVVALEACHRRLETDISSDSRRTRLIAAAGSFAPAILTSLVITALTFLPVFAFTGETGRLLRPLALTKTLVVASAALVTLTLAPALRDRLLGGRVTPEFDNPLTRGLVRLYRPFVHFALTRPVLTLATAAFAVASCIPILSRIGGEFLPRVDEGDLLFMPTTMPGTHPEHLATQLRRQDQVIAKFKEVDTVFGKIGRADTATDPAPYSMAETTIRLRPRSDWPKVPRTRWYTASAPAFAKPFLRFLWPEEEVPSTADLVGRLDNASRMPGWANAWTAPARARMDMMSTGVRTPIGIRIVSQDPKRLDSLGAALRAMVSQLPGTRSAVFESLGGEPWLDFVPDPDALRYHHVDPRVVDATADLLFKGNQIGEIEHEGRKMRVRVLPDASEPQAGPADQVRAATVRAFEGSAQPISLALLGRTIFAAKPTTIRTERGELVAYIYVDPTDGTDVLGYVTRAQHEIDDAVRAKRIELGEGERIEWTGQYDLFAAGQRKLKWIVPTVAISMFVLLFLQFRSLTEALIVLVSVPFALVGSFWTLFLLGYPLSAPVWVGLLSVVGLAMQTGVVMVVYIDEAFHRRVRAGQLKSREDIVAAHAEGTVLRLRPKIMTITTMAAALLPLLWTEGAGAEIMKRVAAPMVGGLATSAFLTLEVLPVLYTIWRHRQLRRAQRLGVSIENVVGTVPSWARG